MISPYKNYRHRGLKEALRPWVDARFEIWINAKPRPVWLRKLIKGGLERVGLI